MTCIGLLSDTHVPHRMPALPPALFERLDGVDLILHAGDLDDPAVLDQLGRIAPVQAVRGNLHLQAPWPNDQRLPLSLDLEIQGRRFLVTHGHLSFWRNVWDKHWLLWPDHRARANACLIKRLPRVFPGADVYVFGHSHRALVERRGGRLLVNPGAVCPTAGEVASVARLTLTPESVAAEIVPLAG
jgi:putative phosphoesterase